jgi:hypothetical protein
MPKILRYYLKSEAMVMVPHGAGGEFGLHVIPGAVVGELHGVGDQGGVDPRRARSLGGRVSTR